MGRADGGALLPGTLDLLILKSLTPGPEHGYGIAQRLKTVSDDSNNALVDYAAKNSSAVEARVNNAPTEAEKSAIWDKARQGASYRLDDTIGMNSRSRRAATCSALLYATVEDATAQKQVDFKVEQAADGKLSVSVTPFQFAAPAR